MLMQVRLFMNTFELLSSMMIDFATWLIKNKYDLLRINVLNITRPIQQALFQHDAYDH